MSNHLPTFTANDVEIVGREILCQGFFRYARYHLKHRLFNGGWTPVFDRELMERTSAAGILPYDPVLDRVVLIYQFRPGALIKDQLHACATAHAAAPWLIEIVAGVLDSQEHPQEVAEREADEEAGCRILELYPIEEYFVSPGGSNEYIHVYCGRVDTSKLVNGTHGLKNEHEDIYAFSLPFEEAFELLRQGKIKTAPAIIALQWLQINRNFLRDFWLQKPAKENNSIKL